MDGNHDDEKRQRRRMPGSAACGLVGPAESHGRNSADGQLADRQGHQHPVWDVCTYAGSAGTTTISLNMQSCLGGKVNNIKCLNGDSRDMEVATGAITGIVDDLGIGGTEEQTWNTFVSGTTSATGPMVISSALRLRRGPFVD